MVTLKWPKKSFSFCQKYDYEKTEKYKRKQKIFLILMIKQLCDK